MWVAKQNSSGLVTWHSCPDGENTKCGIHVPHDWQAQDEHPRAKVNTDNRLCGRCVPPKKRK